MKHINSQSKTPSLAHGRGADRFDTELPVEIGGVQGLTRNISATGIYFETEMTQDPGSHVHFSVEVHVHGQRQKLACDGEVVRINRKHGVLGVAAKLMSSFFLDAADVIDVNASSLAGKH
ncbi:PilZ domain-containing protein [Rhodoferax ferrireducens]|uniref:PilZ domain-containing protein n=1 Tax=Rhodoferax ferrireducens TaxID=192843 RepID=UPI000E0D8656